MTLANCKRLLKHYEETKQLERAEAMRGRVAMKEKKLQGVETPKKETSKKSA